MQSHIDNITIFVRNTRIISTLLVFLSQIIPYLQKKFFLSKSILTIISTNIRFMYDPCFIPSLGFFFEKILVMLKLLLMQPRSELNRTLNFSLKKCKTEYYILNIFDLFSKNLIKSEF